MPKRTGLFLCGALGGISTNIFGLAIQLLAGPTVLPDKWRALFYVLGLLVLGSLGGGMAIIWDEKTLKKAFYAGIGLPAFLRLAVADVGPKTQTSAPAVHTSRAFGFVTPAFAETNRAPRREPRATSASSRAIRVRVNPPQSCKLLFYSQDGKQSSAVTLDASPDKTALVVPVPAFADSFAVNHENTVSDPVMLSASSSDEGTYSVDIQNQPWTGFWTALGANDKSQYKVTIRSTGDRSSPK